MIDRQRLLDHLKPLLREMETDLRARCDEVAQINAELTKEYEEARTANRVGVTFEEWRADLITQVAVAWVLSSVFVRFLEDNALILPPRISGPLHSAGDGQCLMRARDERALFFRSHPTWTDRDYLLAVFDDLAKLPGTKDVFGPHNLVSAYRDWLSGDAAQKLIEFFQKVDTDGTGEIIHNFTDAQWDTRFLGDLYQDLSEAARKKYALLQTPIFVEEFILERTLEPAIREFGIKDFKMIDPACGSGHFLLGSFARILSHWRKAEPGTNNRELVNHALAAIHGVDLNPYAVSIARFRLLLAAMKECQITRIKDAPNFQFNLASGDSLLHGSPAGDQLVMDGFHELAHHYQSENAAELHRILMVGQYHTVVANPPYITVKDRALNQAYRERYPDVCHMKYSLAIPFMQRLFSLACKNGFTGQITANSFMKREFGKKLVESYLPKVDLTHVIDTSGAYIPGHGTPTVILFGQKRRPVSSTIRAVLGIKGEPITPAEPAEGLVWRSIVNQIDQPGSQSAFVSVNDTQRDQFCEHPWSIGGGGAAELKEVIDDTVKGKLWDWAAAIGITAVTGEDDLFILSVMAARRLCIEDWRNLVVGDIIRDWNVGQTDVAIWLYDDSLDLKSLESLPVTKQFMWSYRAAISRRKRFGTPMLERGLTWYEWQELYTDKLRTPMSIVFAFVATHNHFVLDRGGKVFNRSAPVIKLPAAATEDDHLALLGLLNSSTACFWMQQTMHNKGGPGGASSKDEKWHDFYEFSGTQLKQFPLPSGRPVALARKLDALAQQLATLSPDAIIRHVVPTAALLTERHRQFHAVLNQMIALQEELDWSSYALYGLIPLEGEASLYENPPPINLGQRAFEIVLARHVAASEVETKWFTWLGITPNTNIPSAWPEEYRQVVQRRIEIIENDSTLALIEDPRSKRRWEIEPWEQQQEKTLRNWLLDRIESYFDLDGRMNDQKTLTAKGNLHEPKLTSVAQVADLARQDKDFIQVAELFAGRPDFDVTNLVGDLIAAESVPCLPRLRFKPTGLDKRAAWERTWELQRLEDAVDALFEVERLKKIEPAKAEEMLLPFIEAFPIDEQVKRQVMADALKAAWYVAKGAEDNLNPLHLVIDVAKTAKQKAVGDIPVPPKYTSADFLSSNFWRLRGKLDVPKERWVSFPHCEGEDATLVIAWAGYDHLQLSRAIAERYEQAKELEGRKLVPLLACIGQLIPWLKQWHNEMDPVYGTRMGDYFEDYLVEEAKALEMTVAEVMAWKPPEQTRRRRGRRRGMDGI